MHISRDVSGDTIRRLIGGRHNSDFVRTVKNMFHVHRMCTIDLATALSRDSLHGVELYEHLAVVVASIYFWAANLAYTPPFVLPHSRALSTLLALSAS